jgi:hypothetical protein
MRWFAGMMLFAALVVTGCDGNGSDADATPTSTLAAGADTPEAPPTATQVIARPSPVGDSAAVAVQVQAFLTALQNGDREQIQALAGEAIPLPEIDALATCIPEGVRIALETRNIVVDGDEAVVSMAVSMRVGIGVGQNKLVELRYLEDDGEWKLAQLPPCPYDGPRP